MIYFNEETFDFSRFHWHGDHSSTDMGYKEEFNIGLYSYYELYMYLNTETLEVIDVWFED